MRQAEDNRHGHRLNALILELWPAELRIQEALSLTETDLDQRRGSFLVRHGKNDRRREVGMDAWAWSAIDRGWLTACGRGSGTYLQGIDTEEIISTVHARRAPMM